MNNMNASIISGYIQDANNYIKKGQRYLEMCTLLLNNHIDTNNYHKINLCFSWIEHSNKTPKEIFNEVFT